MNGQTDPIGLLAELAARMRPGWDLSSVKAALADPFVMRKEFPAVVAAVGVCYGDPGTKAPGRLTVDGPWWHIATVGTPTPGRFLPSERPVETPEQAVRRREAKEQIRAVLGAGEVNREKAEA